MMACLTNKIKNLMITDEIIIIDGTRFRWIYHLNVHFNGTCMRKPDGVINCSLIARFRLARHNDLINPRGGLSRNCKGNNGAKQR